MTAILLPNGKQDFQTATGSPLVGGKLYTYAAGTSTPQTTWSDAAQTSANTNPIILDARGEATIFWNGVYKIVLQDAAGVTVWTVDNVTAVGDPASTSAYAASSGSSLVGFIQAGTGAVARTAQSKMREAFSVEDFGAVGDGVTDDTAAFNAATLAAYKAAANVASPSGETYSVRVECKSGRDYKILGSVLVPSQVRLKGNGARLIGNDGAAGGLAFSSGGQKLLQTAYYNGSALVSNEAAASETVWRVVNAGIEDFTIINTNCAINAVNLQEQSTISGIYFVNCSAPLRMKGCFYARIGHKEPLFVRQSATAANQPAILLWGVAAHEMDISARIVGASVGIEVTATNSFSIRLTGSFEEGYAIGAIGLKNNGAYCQSWTMHSYVEGVRKGIVTTGGGAFFACSFSPGYFSSCEYAVQAGESGFRACTFDDVSFPDEGVGIRNLMDFSAPNNDVRVRLASLSSYTGLGVRTFPQNLVLCAGSYPDAVYMWADNTGTPLSSTLAIEGPALAAPGRVRTGARSGRVNASVVNQIPMTDFTYNAGTGVFTLDTQISYDAMQCLTGFYRVQDTVSTYDLRFWVDDTTVTPRVAFAGGKAAVVSNNAGLVRVVLSGFSGAANIFGGIYHDNAG